MQGANSMPFSPCPPPTYFFFQKKKSLKKKGGGAFIKGNRKAEGKQKDNIKIIAL